ncbi:SdpI family protein [Leifsonia sp. P73]|uniref:SdpI family protein n=1 Tax=Leifsonia sp. P73 TaxID=3423959 RepID=UPI003DA447CB
MTTNELVAAIAIALFIPTIAWALFGMVRAASRTLSINSVIGVRLPSLMKNEESWFGGHAAAAPIFFWSAVTTSVFSVATCFVAGVESLYVGFLVVSVVSLIVGSTGGIVVAHRAAMAIPPDELR